MLDEKNCRYIANNKIIELSILESYILKILIDNKNKVVKYNELSLKIYGVEDKKGRNFFKNTFVKRKTKRNTRNKNKNKCRVLYKLKKWGVLKWID